MSVPNDQDEVAWALLSASQLAEVRAFGVEQPTTAGQLLFRAGEASYDLFVVLDGEVEVVRPDGAEAVPITAYGPGGFVGELNLLTGQRRTLDCRVTQPGRVLVIAEAEFRRLMGSRPALGEIIFGALLARREILRSGEGAQAIRIIGSRYSPEAMRLRAFAEHSHLAHAWIDVEDTADLDAVLADMGLTPQDIPAVITATEILRRPSAATFAEHLGLTFRPIPGYIFDLVVVGSGPAGLAAAVYGASEGLRTVSIDAVAIGGQAGMSSRIENYAGFPNGISGEALTGRAAVQAMRLGARLNAPCEVAGLRTESGFHVIVLADGSEIPTRAVIVACGARYQRLAVKDLDRFEGAGVYYAATDLEARVCSGTSVMVIGGGNSAGQAALYLAQNNCGVTIAIRRVSLAQSMSQYLIERIEADPKINLLTGVEVQSLAGETRLERVTLKRATTGAEQTTPCSGLFCFIGASRDRLVERLRRDARPRRVRTHRPPAVRGRWRRRSRCTALRDIPARCIRRRRRPPWLDEAGRRGGGGGVECGALRSRAPRKRDLAISLAIRRARPAQGVADATMSDVAIDRQDAVGAARSGDLEVPEELSRRKLRTRLLFLAGLVLAVVALVTLFPGLEGLRTRLSHAKPAWLLLGMGLKVLSGLGYVAIFRMVFCRRMSWRVSYQIGMSELGANALFPTGGAGGLALGAWALKRGGMPASEIARRTAAFFLLTSVANVVGVIIVGVGLAVRAFPGETNLALTLLPAAIATIAIVASLLAGRASARLHLRLERSEEGDSSRRSTLVSKTLVAIADGVNEAVALLREGNSWLIGGILAYLVFDVMIVWATFHAFGSAPPLAIVWIAYLIGELGGLIPVPGGVGGVDLGLVGTFTLYNVPITAAASAVLAYRAIALWVPAILGSVAFIALRRTLRRESAAIAVCAPQTEMEVIGLGRVTIGATERECPTLRTPAKRSIEHKERR